MSAAGYTHSLGEASHRLRAKWGALLAFGLLLILLGVLSLTFVMFSTLAMVTLNGVFFIVAGAAEIGVGMHARSWGRFFFWVIGGHHLPFRRRVLHPLSARGFGDPDADDRRRADRRRAGARLSWHRICRRAHGGCWSGSAAR